MKREHNLESKIPSGYTVVEYLKATQSQYIDTGVCPTDKTKVEIKCAFTNAYGYSVLGANPYFVITSSSIDKSIRFRRNNVLLNGDPNDGNRVHEIVFDRTNAYVDGNLKCTFTDSTFTSPHTMLLFARHSQNGGIEEKSDSIIYWCDVYENDELVREFAPVLDNNGRPCMFDIVGQQPYYNAGSGEFQYN